MAEEKLVKVADDNDESIKKELERLASDGKTEVKTQKLSATELKDALEEVEAYESNEDNQLSLAELGEKLLSQKGKGKARLEYADKKKLFTEKGAKNPNGEEVTMNARDDDYEAYLELTASYQSGKNGHPLLFLKGEVGSVIYTENMDNVLLIVYMGVFEVRIPVSEYMWLDGLQDKKYTQYTVEQLYNYAVMRIGTECTFKVEAIDAKNRVAYASRLRALGVEGFANYVRKQEKTQQPRYVVGQKILAKVVCVQSSFVICEAFGAEFMIRDNELAWAGIDDVYKYFDIGDTFYVKILAVGYEVVKMPSGASYKKVNVSASKRLVDPNPFDKYAKRYRPDMVTTAIVTRIGDSGMRMTLGTKNQPTISSVFCDYPLFLPRDERPKVGDTIRVAIVKINEQYQFIKVRFEKVLKRED